MELGYTRYIDVKGGLVFINPLESVSMDLSRMPKEVSFYIEIGDFWQVQYYNAMTYPMEISLKIEDWDVREIALEILEEAVLIWEKERKMKFTKDMYKEYEDTIIEYFKNLKQSQKNQTE